MITKNEQIHLKKILGSHYTASVLKNLMAKKICNKNGLPHNAKYIRMVFQGLRNNEEIETAIWELALYKKNALNDLNRKKEIILKKKMERM